MTNKRKLYQTFLMTMVMMLLFPLTSAAENVGYAVFNSESGTLTFKYGEKPAAVENETVYDLNKASEALYEPGWLTYSNSITNVVFDASFSQARPTTCFAWFCGCSKLTSIEGIENLNTSSVTDMSSMFASCSELASLDLSYFDTSKVTAMVGMFEGCVNLTTIYVSNYFQTDQVQKSENMFNLCTSLEGIIPCYGQFNIDKTYANFTNGYFLAVPYVQIDESRMYFKCDGNVKPDRAYSLNEGTQTPGWSEKASEISYVGFDESFKYIRPTSCYKWFSGFSYLTDLDLSYLNTSKVTNMSEMFNGCSRLTKIIVSDKFTTDNVQSSNDMFAGCTSLEGIITCDGINNIDKTYANFTNGYLSAVPYATLSDGVLTFKCDGAKLGWALGDGFQGWHFANPNSITKVVFDESFKNARPTSCLDWFFECSNLNTIEGFENFNTSKVTDMREMFKHCHGLKSLDLTNFDTSNVTDMGLMFYDCPRLTTIYVSDKFTTDNVQKSEEMFSGCTSLSGAITCDGTNNIDGTYANYFTGYFTYGIKSADDLASFAECVNTAGKDGGEAVLLNDITMTAEDNFTPITRNYTGKFDGQGHTISGLNFSESKNNLFAQNGGTIRNLGIVNAKIAEGATGSLCQTNSGTMEKCFFMGTTTSSEGATMPNGAVCQTNNGTITRCYYLASNEVSNGGKTAEQFEGGAVCYLLNDGMTDGTQTWYQNIDNGANDAYPVIDNTHGTVYPCTPCTGVYSNEYGKTANHIYPTEFDGNGFMKCSHCEVTQYQPASQNTSNQYEIGNAGQLYWFAGLVNGTLSGLLQNQSACAVLTQDITVNSGVLQSDGSLASNASGFTAWTPIGTQENPYSGTFDGNGHTISGLYFNDKNKAYVGLFGKSNGTIKNVGVVNSYFYGYCIVGAVCGENNGTIQNCYNHSTIKGTKSIGGICGIIDGQGKILNCYNVSKVIGSENIGGVCGNNNNGTITNCYNNSTVRGTEYIGGICGIIYSQGKILNCYNVGVISNVTKAGGVCGSNIGGTITNCYYLSGTATGGINGADATGSAEGKTTDDFASGEVAYLLNGRTSAGNSLAWYQNIDKEDAGKDDYPLLDSNGHGKVYQCTLCTGVYSNTENKAGDHLFGENDNGFCHNCKAYQPATLTTDKYDINGDTTKDNVYEIGNAGQLYWFAGLVNGTLNGVTQNKSANAVLTADIIVNESVIDSNGELKSGDFISWTPIGTSHDNEYIGTFNGQGHTISGLFNNENKQYVGLFGYSMDATIQNVGVVNSYFYGNTAGGVCGHILRGSIQNCYNNSTINGKLQIGGICGFSDGQGKILNCYNIGTVIGTNSVGGVCGRKNSNATITNCYYLSGTATGGIGNVNDATGSAESKSLTQFKSGEVAYLLNEGKAFGTQVWGQQINVNDFPLLGLAYKVLMAAQDGMEGTNYWATFSNLDSNAELTAPTGNVTVYNATVSSGTLTLAKRGDRVAAGEGVLLKANCEYLNARNISETVSAAAAGENHLVATPAEAKTITAGEGYTLYRLTYDDVYSMKDLGFYLGLVKNEIGDVTSSDGSQLNATPNKAYLKVATADVTQPSGAAARGFVIPGDDGETTGIECITVTDESSHRNGNAEGIFDLQGRKVSKPTKGVYINNGKKVIIK